jgi:hypothetical protein
LGHGGDIIHRKQSVQRWPQRLAPRDGAFVKLHPLYNDGGATNPPYSRSINRANPIVVLSSR